MFIDWNAVKMLIHFTLANGFKAIPMKSEKVFFFFFFFFEIDKLLLKFIWKCKILGMAEATLGKKMKDLYHLILMSPVNLWLSRECGTGIKIVIKISGTE